MRNFKAFFNILFFVLIGIILFESGYLLISLKRSAGSVSILNGDKSRINPSGEAKLDLVASAVRKDVEFLVRDGLTKHLDELLITYTYSGSFQKFEQAPRSITNRDFPMQAQYLLVFKTANGADRGYYYAKEEFKRMEFYENNSGELISIDPTDLKVGDSIQLTQTINLLKPPEKGLIKAQLIKNP